MNPLLSICIIGKNEEKCIERCLKAVADLSIPIVYTDTGSTDQTLEIASRYTDLIYHFDWCNDFSKARNFCADKAPTDWIWVLDCDEEICERNPDEIFTFCSLQDNESIIGTVVQKDFFLQNGEPSHTYTRLGRIYHRKHYHYEGAIHEQILPLSDQANIAYHDLAIAQNHDGYIDPELLLQKSRRNIELLLSSLAQKEDPYMYYQLGRCYNALGQPQSAADAFRKGLSFDLDPALFYVQSMVESYGYCLLELKQYKTALTFEHIYETFAVSADFVFLMGLIYMNNGQFTKSIEQFSKATAFRTSVAEGANSYRAFHNIGVIYECLGQTAEAIANYQKAGNYQPSLNRLEVLTRG
ncbi:MAG: glycosyltransferase [Lachnospiraceae bacterium]|nr:glycosyltransferase [Lachnospiraceae bacterium]